MNLNDRISKIIDYSELSSSEFADKVNVQRSSISHITSGRNKPSLDFLVKVKEHFPELEWDWLITGEGEMLRNTPQKDVENIDSTKPKPTSLPDLFSLIDDENFGITESEDRIQKSVPSKLENETHREFRISEQTPQQEILSDSQRLGLSKNIPETQITDNQQNKIKRIILFFENGKFESFEP